MTSTGAVRFGLVLAGQFLPEDDPQKRLAEAIEQVRQARDAGFDAVWATQHFLADFQFLQPVPFLSRLAAEAGHMTVGTSVMLLPLYPPVLLAEEIATLDVITGGRFVFGAGTGYRDEEFAAFGISRGERVKRFVEVLGILRRLWAGETVDHDGPFYPLRDAQLRLLPVQGADLPVWIGAGGEKSIRRAARLGDEWLVSPELPLSDIVERQAFYREALPEGIDPALKHYPLLREAFVASTREEAVRVAGPALRTKYEAYAKWGYGVGSVDDMFEDIFVIGSGQDCSEQIERYRAGLGTTHVSVRMQWPGLDQRAVLDSIARWGEEVIPRFRRSTTGTSDTTGGDAL